MSALWSAGISGVCIAALWWHWFHGRNRHSLLETAAVENLLRRHGGGGPRASVADDAIAKSRRWRPSTGFFGNAMRRWSALSRDGVSSPAETLINNAKRRSSRRFFSQRGRQ